MNIWQKIQELLADKPNYDQASQALFNHFPMQAKELESIDEMKKSEGWKLIENALRVDLKNKILEKVKDDKDIQAMLKLIVMTDSKNRWRELEDQIDELLPK